MHWNLDYLYPNLESFKRDIDYITTKINNLQTFEGKLGKKEFLTDFLLLREDIIKTISKLYLYGCLSSDVDINNEGKKIRKEQVIDLYNKIEEVCAFFDPEILEIGESKILKTISTCPLINDYNFYFKKLFHNHLHILSKQEELILVKFNPIFSISDNLYQSLSLLDSSNEVVKLSDGTDVAVNLENHSSLIIDAKTSEDRKNINAAVFKRFALKKNSFTNLYSLIFKNLLAHSESRKYSSLLESELKPQNIPTSVYTNLIEVAKENTDILKKYFSIRQRYLNLDGNYTYDRFLSLAKNKMKYPYTEAKELFLKSIAHLGDEFIKAQTDGLADGFVDVSPCDNKTTGAYSFSVYPLHPYILLNHDNTDDALFTLAHEAGHSAHSILSTKNNSFINADYEIFTAEIASTFNEHVLLDYMLSISNDKESKIALIDKALSNIVSTFYRQTIFAAYELEVAKLVENDTPLTSTILSNIFIDLYKVFYDIDLTKEENGEYIWAYIPHFFNSPFYVYQYATSFSASLKFFDDVKSLVPNALKNYLSLLKSGGSDFPVALVAKAGVDLTNKSSFEAVIKRFNELLLMLEIEINKE